MRRSFAFLLLCLCFCTSISYAEFPTIEAPVKNIIIMIGDGMGFQHVATARSAAKQGLVMDTAPVKASLTTRTIDGSVTDSGGGTALASGYKTSLYHVGVDPDGNQLVLISEAARDAGKAVGIVTTARLTDATPAAFSAHVVHRDLEAQIAVAQMESGFDLFLGGGAHQYCLENTCGDASRPIDLAVEQGYMLVTNKMELDRASQLPLLGLFAKRDLAPERYRRFFTKQPSLAQMTAKALELLSQSEMGFFLMVEGALIDKRSHINERSSIPTEVLAFDKAVAVCVDFVMENPDTLLIVTADHETGGLTLVGDGSLKFTSISHTDALVPLYVFGRGAEAFSDVSDNTDVANVAFRLGGLRRTGQSGYSSAQPRSSLY